MRRSGIFDLVKLHQSFEKYGKHDRLLDYLAQPRIHLGSSNQAFIELCVKLMESRTPFDQAKAFFKTANYSYAPHDSTIFKARFDLLSTNNRAYAIAIKANPSVQELEEFSYIDPGWSVLFPLKLFLIFHASLAMLYRGLLPFGDPIVQFYNTTEMGSEIQGSPSFSDHVRLREVTNALAEHLGCSTVMLNNEQFLDGSKIKTE
jgi:hypothetical protein